MATTNRLPSDRCLKGIAREALDSRAGRRLTDAEWMRARNNLLEFVKILSSWERAEKKAQPMESELGRVA